MSVRDYLSYVSALRSVPKNKRAERLEAALDAGKLEDRADTLIRKLSKGYRQRVGIAQAVIHDPPVLILDEPSAGLDPRQRVETRRFIKSLARDHTIILSTHILPDVQATCSRVVIINKGRLVAEDAPENLDKRIGGSDHLSVLLKTPSADVSTQLELLPGVLKAGRSANESTLHGEVEFAVDVEPEVDAREDVARLCVQQNWGLLELRRARRTLEVVFLELTTSDERLEEIE
jgi:ABC-2 type transport system ATP-binding protein